MQYSLHQSSLPVVMGRRVVSGCYLVVISSGFGMPVLYNLLLVKLLNLEFVAYSSLPGDRLWLDFGIL